MDEPQRGETTMSMENKIRAIAGTFVLASLALGWWVSPWWFLFTAFVGVNLLQSAFTKWCLMEDILRWTGIHEDRERAGARGA
jgi:hypothetical protein